MMLQNNDKCIVLEFQKIQESSKKLRKRLFRKLNVG